MTRTAKTAHRLRAELVDELRSKGVVYSDAVADAFATVPRERFIPDVMAERGLEAVYRDQAFVTKKDPRGMPLSSSSQPALMARMLELLDLQPGLHVLEVGTGSGYNAALLAHLVGPRGRVTSIDVDSDLARLAGRALKDSGYRVAVHVGDGREGWKESAPYDRIIVTACADEIRRRWLEQLKDGGLLELPLRLDPDRAAIQVIPVLQRRGDRLRSTALTSGGFMPLHAGDGGWRPPPSTLTASRSGGGKHASLVSITGPGLSALPESAARELLAAALTSRRRPRSRGVIGISSAEPPLLLLYLLQKIPADRRLAIHSDAMLGVGLMHRRSRSLAFVSVQSPWMEAPDSRKTRAPWRLDSYGGDAAAGELERLLGEWEAMQAAGRQALRIVASGSGEVLRLRFRWERP
jgi:methyltransferase of FxLD system